MQHARPRVVAVGLGPAGPEHITAQVLDAIACIPHRYLRTGRHPSATAVPDAATFDEIYESADTFGDVYLAITDRLVAAASEHGEILYAVPGSPFVLERTVRHLLSDDRVEVEVLTGMSFLDLAYQRLDIDPIEAGVRLIDGHTFMTSAAGHVGPLLVAHCHNQRVLSDIKLAVENPPTEPVVVLQRLGLPDENIVTLAWSDLDRDVVADHLTSIYIPRLDAPVAHELVNFAEIVRRLRAECPWDRAQTHASLARYAVEETYELVEAIGALDLNDDGQSDDALMGELGDVLLQVVLHAAIAEQNGRFNLADVAAMISNKMVRRHPHVFGDVTADSAETVLTNWEAIKAAERAERGEVRADVFDGIDGALPSLSYANELVKVVTKRGFTWPDAESSAAKVREELAEVLAASTPDDLATEIGDLLHAVVVLARKVSVDPEVALRQASATFRLRFETVEAIATERSERLDDLPLDVMLERWNEAKARLAPS